MTTYDVAVVGGGLLGTATAYELAGLGARTAVLERNTLGAAASGQNAGTLNLIHENTRRFDDLGFRLRALLAPFGIEIPLRIQFFQACTTVTAAHFLPHGIRRMAGSLTLKQRPDGRCVLGGGWTGHSYFPGPGTLRPETLEANRAVAARIVPQFARLETDDAWGSYDGSSIDGQPILDEAPPATPGCSSPPEPTKASAMAPSWRHSPRNASWAWHLPRISAHSP